MSYTETIITANDGLSLFLRTWEPDEKEPQAILVLVHGLAEHAGRYHHVVKVFLQHGYVIYGHDHRGFGRSGGRRGDFEHFDQVLADLDQVVKLARSQHPGLPLGMFAHSMGGTIGVQYLTHHPDQFRAAILSAPGFGPGPTQNKFLLRVARLLAIFAPTLTIHRGSSGEYKLSHDPAQAEAWDADPYVHDLATPRFAVQYLQAATEAKAQLRRLRLPILVVMGEDDVTINQDDIREAVAAAGDNLTFVTFPGAYHEVHNEIQEIREKMLSTAVAWMAEKLQLSA
ncbi:MAG TPA: alpha/beta hydrolase [Caldilineae bacterium]|nr:alpha/beta hydrolase [Caldilineae bacterium]